MHISCYAVAFTLAFLCVFSGKINLQSDKHIIATTEVQCYHNYYIITDTFVQSIAHGTKYYLNLTALNWDAVQYMVPTT